MSNDTVPAGKRQIRMTMTVEVPDDAYDYEMDVDGRMEDWADTLLAGRRISGIEGGRLLTPPNIEIIVDRNPDAYTEVVVYVDGVQLQPTEGGALTITSIDPGAGCSPGDWAEQREWAAERASNDEVAAFIRASFHNYDQSQFITD